RIILIGNLGYQSDRRPGTTPVFILDLDSFRISTPKPLGTPPGWLFKHQATLSTDGHSILIAGGKLELSDDSGCENIDDWLLHLDDFRWGRLTDRKWQQWRLVRKDGERFHLFQFQFAIWRQTIDLPEEAKSKPGELTAELGVEPDLSLFPQLFAPNLPHESLPDDDNEFKVHRIRIDGIVVKYHEGMHWIHLTIE